MRATVGVIIVTYNSRHKIGACLESVFSERRNVDQQVIVVDNDSKDGTAEFIRTTYPQAHVVTPGENLGFAAAVNLGVKHTQAEYVLLLNPDTVILKHAVDEIVDFSRCQPGHGLYGGRTLKLDGSLEPSSCWGVPSLWSMTMFATGLTTIAPNNSWFDPESLGKWQRDSVREVGVVTGCFLLTPKSVWEKLGGMDERYFMYGEDVDLALRAKRLGYHPIINPKAMLIHEVGQSSKTSIDKALLLYRGKASLIRTHWTGPARWLGLFLLLAGTGLRAALSYLRSKLLTSDHEADQWRALWTEYKSWLQGYPPKQPNSH